MYKCEECGNEFIKPATYVETFEVFGRIDRVKHDICNRCGSTNFEEVEND